MTAVELLANAANAAANTPAGTGDWAYRSVAILFNAPGLHTLRMQIWDKTDGTDQLTREDRDGRLDETRTGDTSAIAPPGHNGSYIYLATLPTDPTALRNEIYTEAQNKLREMGPNAQQLYTVDQLAFQRIGSLTMRAAPPALKAALYRVAATIPDVEYIDDMTDAVGRHGIGVAHSTNNAGDRVILIFDRTTYQVLGGARESHDGGTESQALLATGLVEEAGQTP
jgi:hypothetical protein